MSSYTNELLLPEWQENYNADVQPHGITPSTAIQDGAVYSGQAAFQSGSISTFGTLYDNIGIGKASLSPYFVYSITFTIYASEELIGQNNMIGTLVSSKLFNLR